MVARNVVALVDAPTMVHREMSTLGDVEVRRPLSVTTDDRLAALRLPAVTAGMCLRELLVVRQANLAFTRGHCRSPGPGRRLRGRGYWSGPMGLDRYRAGLSSVDKS